MDARRKSVTKNDEIKLWFYVFRYCQSTSKTHVTEVYTTICSHTLQPHVLRLNVDNKRVSSYLRIKKTSREVANESNQHTHSETKVARSNVLMINNLQDIPKLYGLVSVDQYTLLAKQSANPANHYTLMIQNKKNYCDYHCPHVYVRILFCEILHPSLQKRHGVLYRPDGK